VIRIVTQPSREILPGSVARCTDGPAGIVERPIVSPRTELLTHLGIERLGAPETYWIVPATEIAVVHPDSVQLTLTRATLNQRPAHRRLQGLWLRPDPAAPPVVFPDRRPDAEVADRVLAILRADPIIGAGDVSLEVDDGLVTVRGQVPTALARLAAVKLAETAPGVGHVRNELLSDEETAAAINRLLKEDDEIRRHYVRALVEGGRVFWRHRDAPPDVLARAAVLARGRPGVREVVH
jgi:hypothetical protein